MTLPRSIILFVLCAFWVAPVRAEVDADLNAEIVRVQLVQAQREYTLALERLNAAEANLGLARQRAIEAGILESGSSGAALAHQSQPEGEPAPETKKDEAKPQAKPDPEPKPIPKADPKPKEEPKKVEKPKGPSFWEKWQRNIRIGLNTRTGNSENANLNLQLNLRRKTQKLDTRLDTTYRYATRNGEDTQNRLDMSGRHEWLAQGDSKIGWWVTARLEVDEFQAWDYRVQAHTGISYQFVKNEKTNLKGRTGFGGTRTYGLPEDEFRPEALVTGIDLSHRFNDTMNVEASTEYFLEVTEEARERFNNSVKWNILLDKESNMNLRLQLTHRYDSDPGRNKDPNDVFFDITLGWKF